MYDMYHWDQAAAAADNGQHHAHPAASRPADRGARFHRGNPGGHAARPGGVPAARALQVALDRRDNGGDAATRAE